jgi:hypothetical protein
VFALGKMALFSKIDKRLCFAGRPALLAVANFAENPKRFVVRREFRNMNGVSATGALPARAGWDHSPSGRP